MKSAGMGGGAGTAAGGTAGAMGSGTTMKRSPHASPARMHAHAASHGMMGRTDANAQNREVDKLNQQSLHAARKGEPFAPKTEVR
jgi:hypothetical protein